MSHGQGNRRTYAGWVPTITGQLSFSVIGTAEHTIVANGICENGDALVPATRHVVLSHTHRTKDLPWPFRLISSAKAEYLMIGSSGPSTRPLLGPTTVDAYHDEIGVLSGRIYVIPAHEDAAAKAKKLLKTIRQLIADAGDDAPRGTYTQLDTLGQRVTSIVTAGRPDIVAVGADFELYRTGEFRLTLDPDSELPVVPDDGGDERRFYGLIANQIYYFAKDMAHRHYHHQNSSDNLLPIVETSPADDEMWRRETLWALARSVLEMRRRNRLAGHKHALGVLAYAEAFQGLLGQVKRREGGGFERIASGTLYDFQHTRMSLEATIEERSFRLSTQANLHGLAIATLLGSAALWIAAVEIKGSLCPSSVACAGPKIPEWVQQSLTMTIEKPEVAFGLLLMVGLAYFEFTRRAIFTIAPIRGFGGLVSEWAVAIGASVSRRWRKRLATGGDTVGNALGLLAAGAFMASIVYSTGAVFQLWPFLWLPRLIWTALFG